MKRFMLFLFEFTSRMYYACAISTVGLFVVSSSEQSDSWVSKEIKPKKGRRNKLTTGEEESSLTVRKLVRPVARCCNCWRERARTLKKQTTKKKQPTAGHASRQSISDCLRIYTRYYKAHSWVVQPKHLTLTSSTCCNATCLVLPFQNQRENPAQVSKQSFYFVVCHLSIVFDYIEISYQF